MKIKFILLSALGLLALIKSSVVPFRENLEFLALAADGAKTLSEVLPSLDIKQKYIYALAMDLFYAKNHPGYVGGFNDSSKEADEALIDLFIKVKLETDPTLDDLDTLNALVKQFNLDEKSQNLVLLAETQALSEILSTLTKEQKIKYARAIDLDYASGHPWYVGGFDDSDVEVSEEKVNSYIKVMLVSNPAYDNLDLLNQLVEKYKL